MDSPASPPKRLTRARAAARAATSSTAASAAKSKATAAAKAKAISSKDAAPAARKSVKRKTRSDEHEEESEVEAPAKRPPPASRTATRATRGPGRPRKTVDHGPEPEPQPAPRAARGRPPKTAASDPAKEEAPARAIRTRTKKTQPDGDEDEDVDDLAPEPVKKATRGRPAGTTTSTSAPTSKPVKKTVTFAEPDKENVIPVTGARKTAAPKPADAPATGLRAKPVRKPAGTGRATRTTATKKPTKTTGDKQASMPLSPKKVTQLSVNRDGDPDSEDELAMDRTPARPFQRSPVKPAVGGKRPTKAREDSDGEEEDLALPPTESTILLGSPVRRPPQSPFKNSMMSPAKRIEGLQPARPAAKDALQSSASPLKASLLQSPAKRPPMLMKPVDLASGLREQTIASPFKQSLFQSPAKRLFSPFKPASAPEEPAEVRSPAPTPVLLCTPPAVDEAEEAAVATPGDAVPEAGASDEEHATTPSKPDFNGRMSTLLPRDVDPALNQATSPVDEPAQDEDYETVVLEEEDCEKLETFEQACEPMVLDKSEAQAEDVALGDISTTPPNSPPQEALNLFGLRQNDLLPFDTTYSESEDELTRVMTPNTVSPVKHMRGSTMRPRTSGFGFTPLARRFDEWQARSPQKTPMAAQSAEVKEDVSRPRDSMKNTFFEDEMCVRPDGAADDSVNDTDPLAGVPEIKDPVVEDISITDEDLELAAEANEMSVMSPEQVESMLNLDGNDDTISEASQEYGDENEIPGQNANYGLAVPPVTPQRFIRREFHTVSKVPLKAADESTPPPQPSLKKRRHSISRLPVARPTHTLSRSATVISYSPSNSKHVDSAFEEAVEESFHERSESVPPPETPSKSELWSQAGTPARTPRPDVNPTLLRGATVFVDVHTMEGADASAIFVELLTQMGARCVKTWHWNPTEEDASSKIGITHVVYKDGGKRTMEKVRETGGLVQCVGVGWVLE